MGFGARVIGKQAYEESKKADAAKTRVAGFGPRVIGQKAYDAARGITAPPVPPVGQAKKPDAPATEAYNVAGAIDAAKANVHDLPRLLALELQRADGPRKTVLRAYREMLADPGLDGGTVAALEEQIAAALGEAV
jgi:hypothetical protein